ncbi:response regulator transcription factor [Amycolatopsis sp. NPDC004625]|uniref:response regulator transcription factor n=1 Tax=Amycolatopsis sp. NPDC004625 TaxID=3154670 RepID=UPI0033BEE945
MTIRVVVADDQPLVRAGLAGLLKAAPGIEVVAEAANGVDAVASATATRPDVVLMDVRMPELDGISATRRILSQAPGRPPRIIILTTFDISEYVYTSLREGAAGFLLKDTPADRIIAAVHAVAAGDVLLSPRITRRLIESFARHHRPAGSGSADLGALTGRETEVLHLVGYGLSNTEIAERLTLSAETVKTHVKRIMGKLRVTSRAQAVVAAYESGLVVPSSAE